MLPEGAATVDVGSVWSNPFTPGVVWPSTGRRMSLQDTVDRYRMWVEARPALKARIRDELAGRDLACSCKRSAPCHGDVLLEIANAR